jgi:glutamyl endopeptidase
MPKNKSATSRREDAPAVPTGDDAPVSNQAPEAGPIAEERITTPPSEGQDPKTNAVSDGAEVVEGHEKTEAALAEMFTAPADTGLRDIGEASFGPPPALAETVHGPDDRVQITNTAIYPWRAQASLLITAADNSMWIGTGWFIGPHTLMTAGHVVYIKNSGVPGRDGWARKIQVMPGRNRTSLPYGSVTSSVFHSVVGWTQNGDENYDYGAIVIPNDLGNRVGWFGFGVFSDADLLASIGNISGYPGDKPAGTQWYDHRGIASVNARKVYYDIDSAGGQSGSAVYRIINGARYGFAVHAYGGATTNSGTRVVPPVYNNMLAWKA